MAAALGASLLHSLPFLRMLVFEAPPGFAWLPTPYIPRDWMQYLALVRQTPAAGQILLADPFTTQPQDGRFILLFHYALNLVHRVTSIDPELLLELARTGAIATFAVLLWRLLGEVLESERTRVWAVVLVLLSGGLGYVGLSVAPLLPPEPAATVRLDLWSMYGWTTWEALYNPLWATGLALLLVVARPLLRPGGPASRREVVLAGTALLALWLTHVYSAIALAVIVAAALASEAMGGGVISWRRGRRIALAVLPPLAVAFGIVLWQLRDHVLRAASGGMLGGEAAPVFWYPLTFGATGVFAVAGLVSWFDERHPWRFAMVGWLAGIALLHSSDVLNGYHFVLYAYVPVAILAARPVERAFARLLPARGAKRVGAAILAALLFASPLVTAARAVAEVADFRLTDDADAAIRALARFPPGNVLCDAGLGNVVPALGPHRAYAGHWFLTPDFQARADRAGRALAPGGADELRRIVAEERIDYVIAPTPYAPGIAAALADAAPRVERFGSLSVVLLRGS